MAFNIVLIHPEIPNNTGNIGRIALATDCHLHLVKPFGFEIDDKRLKRAGLDYWPHIKISQYDSIEDFFAVNGDENLLFFSSHGTQSYWEAEYKKDSFFIFGKESTGLPKNLLEDHKNRCYTIPIYNPKVRSLNLANAVGIVVYEGLKSLRMPLFTNALK